MHTAYSTMLPAGMRPEEYECLRRILRESRPQRTLEIGMANGGSSVLICEELRRIGGVGHVAIDPFQTASNGWGGKGLKAVKDAGYLDLFELKEEFDYLALPALAKERREFDFILIDGWHSFDYTMLDFFFADLLLQEGGVLAIHDTGWPSVYKACRFIESHKPYERLSPPVSKYLKSIGSRAIRRLAQTCRGPGYYRQMAARRTEWFSLAAYRKRNHYQVPDEFFVEF